MDEMQDKIETWMELIQSEKLHDVSKDIQMSIRVRPDSKLNGSIFKLLLRLCRVADKCNKQNCETGNGIAKLAKLLCSLLIEVPDDNNFVKAVFKIVQCLISFDMHEDAAKICCYLQPGKLYNPQGDTMNLLIKVLTLWRVLVNNVYLTLTNEPMNTKGYNKLKSVMKHEMKMIQIAYKDYTNPLIMEISIQLDRIAAIDKDKKYFDDFYKYILKYLSGLQLYLDKNEKYVTYCHVLRIIYRVICRTVETTGIESAVKTLNKLSSYFETLLTEDKECCQCFQQFQRLCRTLLVPMKNLSNDSAKNIQNIICCNLNIAQKYGYAGLKWNAIGIAEIAEPLFTYWQKCVETDNHALEYLLDTGILLELMNLFIHIDTDEFYVRQVSLKCKWCEDKLCTVKKDLYNAIVMKCKYIHLVCKFPIKTLPAEVCALARKILQQNVETIICEMKECKCKRWTQSWYTCRNSMYNIGVLSEHIYEESVLLYSFLCTRIFELEGIESNCMDLEESEDFENVISFALHRLSVVHYNNSKYREAMTACALNALLTCNQSNTKAFRMWINIKKTASEEIANLTMQECLIKDKNKIKSKLGFSLDTSKYDFAELCVREARNLLEEQVTFDVAATVLKKLRKLQSSDQYAYTVQLLGHYFLGFKYDSSILKYHEQAIHDLKRKKDSVAVMCLEANLGLFIFMKKLDLMNKQTRMEMENTKFALYAPKLQELVETKSPNVVPAYTMINVKEDISLMLCLQDSLSKWKRLFEYHFKEIVKNWESNLILRMLITVGEYARLYRYESCEAEVWTLAYKLASEMNDPATIYITSRCISLRQVNYDWITTAKEHIIKQRNSEDENVIRTIAIFWISLADLYYECGKYNEAKQLLTEARSLPGISVFANSSVYLLSLDVIIRNIQFYEDNMQHENYGSFIVESIYVLRNLNQDLLTKKWTNQATYLFSYDILFTVIVNLSTRINSLLSFRGISADLVRILKSAQSLNAMLRTAELLKSLCYIDLSRVQLDDCEVKLQGLEHMLNIETFELSMKSEPIETSFARLAVTPTKIIDPVRDTSQYDASPVLGKKVFDLPKFTLHTNCDCYKCGNVSYQYLVFATTYIRAQLYASQNHTAAAFDHFHGAFEIRQRLFEEEKSVLPENWPRDEVGVKQFSWQTRFYITDYIQLLIDFCCFLKTKIMSRQEDTFDIINLAINICCKYKLEGHPIYVMAKELALDHEFQPILKSLDCLKFMVPQPQDIDINDHIKIPIDPSICVTPSPQNRCTKKPLSVRRKKKICRKRVIWSDDEDDDSLSPPRAVMSP